MSDIITRLLLKTNEFDANLNNAKQSVNGFQSGISSAAQTAGAGIAKFAGAIGLAVGATEAFNKTIGSTQTTGDAFAKIMDQSKASVDAFFTSIAMGDFSGFLSNLENVINKSGDLSVMLDELATKTLFSNAELNTLMLSKKVQENIAKDKTKSDKERNAALLEARSIQLQINKLQSELANTNKQSAYSTLDSAIAKQGLKGNVARSTWDYALKESSRPTLTNYANEYRTRSAKVDNAKEINQSTGLLMETKESKQLKKQLDAWVKTSSGRFAEFAYYFTEMDDALGSDLDKAVEMNNKANAMKGTISDAELILNNTDAKINGSFKKQNGGGAGGGGGADNPAPSGSLAYFDAEIAKKNKELIKATDAQARAAVQVTINELEAKKLNLKILVEKDVFETVHGEMKGGELKLPNTRDIEALNEMSVNRAVIGWYEQTIAQKETELSKATDAETKSFIQSEINKLKGVLREFNKLQENGGLKIGSAYSAFRNNSSTKKDKDGNIIETDFRKQTKGMKLPKVKSPVSKKDIKLNDDYNESLNAMCNIMGSLSGAFDQNTASALQWGATLLTTIGQTVSAIQSAIPAKKASAAASKEEATAEIIDGSAKTINAHASIPFAGIAIGLAGVASIIAMMSSMPKFATGGVVPGVSFTGDKVPAWLNSGEMILNGGQQSNLFRMLNAGLYAGITAEQVQPSMGNVSRFIMPDESDRKIQVFGDFRIKGCDLELAIKNQTNRKSKVR